MMKTLKIKLLALTMLFSASTVFISCEQDAIIGQAQDDVQTLIATIDQDADVARYSAAARLFTNTLNERIVANQEQFDSYLAAGMEKEIDELLYRESMNGLIQDMQEKYEVVLAKYPDIASIDGGAISEYYSNNVTSRGCSWHYYACVGVCASQLAGWTPLIAYVLCVYECEQNFCYTVNGINFGKCRAPVMTALAVKCVIVLIFKNLKISKM